MNSYHRDFAMGIGGVVVLTGLGMDLISGIELPIGSAIVLCGTGIIILVGRLFDKYEDS